MGPGDSGGQHQGRKLTAEQRALPGRRPEPLAVKSLRHPVARDNDEDTE
jgi:hypothetical protein